MFLQNKKGEWVVVPSTITIDVLERLLQLEQGILATTPPRYTFSDAIQILASVKESVAELEAEFDVRIAVPAENAGPWVRIPLRLNQAILVAPIEVTGVDEFLTEYQADSDGHIIWLKVPERAEVTIRLRSRLPIVPGNVDRRVELSLPNRSAHLRLMVPSAEAEGRVGDESSVLTATNRLPEGQTEFVVDSSGGTTQFIWRDAPEAPPVLYSEGNLVVELAGRSFDADAQLRVRSYGPPIDSFTVRLPANVEWLGSGQANTGGVQIVALPTSTAVNGQLLLVRRLEGKTANPIEARIKVSSKASGVAADGPILISGLEVLGAQIQRGTIDFVPKGGITVKFKTDPNLRQVDVPEALRTQDVTARFEYDRQPFSLEATVGKGDPRISVEPTYIVNVEPSQLRLEASLRYRISGGRAEKVVVQPRDWIIDRILPEELVAGAWKVEGDSVEIPVPPSINGRGEFELQIIAHQPLAGMTTWSQTLGQLTLPGAAALPSALGESWVRQLAAQPASRDLSFTLPLPVSTAATPAVLVVVPADNVELSPMTEQIRLLVPDTLPPQVKIPARQQPPLVYREDVTGQMPVFAGSFKVRRQSVSAQVENSVRVDERDLTVEQRMIFDVSFEPATHLTFDVPADLRDSGELEVFFDGDLLTMDSVSSGTQSVANRHRVSIDLPQPQIGNFELTFRYKVPRTPMVAADASTLTAPLVRPVQTESLRITNSTLHLSSVATLRVSLLDDLMRPVEDEFTEATIGEDLTFQLDQVPSHISILPQSAEAGARRSTVVDRVWIQALLTTTERRDRACFRLTTNESNLTFALPPGANQEDLSVVIDGERTDRFAITQQGEVRVQLEDAFGARQLTLELWYWFTAQPAVMGRLDLDAPELNQASPAEQILWEVLLPPNEHLMWTERSLISENTWRWRGAYFARTPTRTQNDLEDWVQAAPRQDIAGFNRYLFRSLGARDTYRVLTVLRPFATFCIAATVFCCGVLLMYVSILRHPLVVIGLGCLLLAVAISFPQLCLVAGQSIAIGLLFLIVSRISMAFVSRRPVSRLPVRTSNSGFSEPRSSKTILRRADAMVPGATATISAPSPFQMSATGNEP